MHRAVGSLPVRVRSRVMTPTAFALAAIAFVGVRALRMSDREFVSGAHDPR